MVHLATLEELRTFALATLCEKADLEPDLPVLETRLYRRGEPCAVEFLVMPTRASRWSALFEAEHQRILFYGPDLVRFHECQVQGPDLEEMRRRPKPRRRPKLRSAFCGRR